MTPERPADLRFMLSKAQGCKDKVACSTTTRLTMNLRCHPFQYSASGENQVNHGNNKGTLKTEICGVQQTVLQQRVKDV